MKRVILILITITMIVLSGCNETKSTYKTKFEKTIAAMKAEDIPEFIQNHADTKKILWAFDDEIRTTETGKSGKYIIIPVVEGKKAFVFFGKDGEYLATEVYDRFKTKAEFDDQMKLLKYQDEILDFDSNILPSYSPYGMVGNDTVYHYTKEGIYVVEYRFKMPDGVVKDRISFIYNRDINKYDYWLVPIINPEDRAD